MSRSDHDIEELARGLVVELFEGSADVLYVSEYLWEKQVPDRDADQIIDDVKRAADRMLGFIREAIERGDI